jgi:hypothetical protein
MHPRFMKRLAVAYAGGSALLLACAVHDDTNFSNPPPPTDTVPPVRTVVFDSGVVTLLDDAGGGPSGIGGGGEFTPDAAEEPDVAPGITLPDSGGPGSSCDLFAATNPCDSGNGCYPNADGTGTCEPQLTWGQTAPGGYCGTGGGACGPQLTCSDVSTLCTNLCHLGGQAGECIGTVCTSFKGSSTLGYCR